MPRKAVWPPTIYPHKSGRARIRINGEDIYLGAFGSQESTQRYLAIVAQVNAERAGLAPNSSSTKDLTVAEVCAHYLEQQSRDRKTPEGKPTQELHNIRYAVRVLVHSLGAVLAKDVSPRHLKTMRTLFINGYKHPEFGAQGSQCRKTVNRNFNRVQAVFRWATNEAWIPAENYFRLKLVKSLLPGEGGARESADVEPVADADLAATIPHLGPVVQDMVLIQLLCGCRPGEIVRLKPADIDKSQTVWVWRLKQHKNAWRRHSREIFLGPNAQDVLMPYLKRTASACCFSPQEAMDGAGKRWKHRTDSRRPQDHYSVGSYEDAINRACKRAKVAEWSPGQLRHNAGTMFTDEFSLEVASVLLGHKSLQTTLIYAKLNKDKAKDAMRKSG